MLEADGDGDGARSLDVAVRLRPEASVAMLQEALAGFARRSGLIPRTGSTSLGLHRPGDRDALRPGTRVVFHACPHWRAFTLLAEGAPLTAVAGHPGDTVETVASTYVHWLRDDRNIPADVLDRVLAAPSRPRHRGRAAEQ